MQPSPSPQSSCTPSTLGYQCMGQLGQLTLHWSVGVPPALAAAGQGGGGTGRHLRAAAGSTVTAGGTDLVYFAAVAPTTGAKFCWLVLEWIRVEGG